MTWTRTMRLHLLKMHLLKMPTLVMDPHLNLLKHVPRDLRRNHPDEFNRCQILQYPQYPHQV